MADKKKRPGFFVSIWRAFRLVQLLIRGAVAVAGGWLAYSRLVIPHKLTLPHALGGERCTFTANGLELSYYVSGDGKPLVLLHSINAAASAYETKPIYEHFAASRRVYALDLPGFGFSARPDIAYSPAVYRDAILAFVREQAASGRGPVDAVALSLSCEFAALAAHAEPELFRSLTFISPSGFYSRPAAGGAQSRGQSDTAYKLLRTPLWSQGFYDLLTTRRSLRLFLKPLFGGGPVDEGLIDYAYLTSHQPGARFAPVSFVSGRLFSPGIRSIYDELKLPVLVLYDRDPFVRFDELPPYGERSNWTLVRIDNTHGLPHFEQPERTNEVLAAFLNNYAARDL